MLTKKKRLYAESRQSGLNMKDSAVKAGYSERSGKTMGSRLERDPDVIKYREKLKSGHFAEKGGDPDPVTPPPKKPDASTTIPMTISNTDAAITILRAQLHSDDERIAQGAAWKLLDYDLKKDAGKGKKKQREDAAREAGKGKYASAPPPAAPLRSVK